jgi:transposase
MMQVTLPFAVERSEGVHHMGQEPTLGNRGKSQRQVAREHLVTAMLEGHSWQQVSAGAPVPLKRAMAYRLLRAVRTKGHIALQDGRHGHPSKLRGAARAFLEEQCRQAPHLSSTTLQAELHEQFGLSVSISQINRVRAMLGLNLHPKGQRQGKKQR